MAHDGMTAVNGQQPTALNEHSKTAPDELYPTRAFEELIAYLSTEPGFCKLRELQLKTSPFSYLNILSYIYRPLYSDYVL